MLKPVQASTYTFRHIIEGNFLYVDKTRHLYEIIRNPSGIYFLSRPRRFGKSLTVSTLQEIFQGSKELFQGLWLHESDYSWDVYPVIRFDFSLERVHTAIELKDALSAFLQEIAARYQLTLPEGNYQRQFRWLIEELAKQAKVVILIDEYDKPILDNIDNLPEAISIREALRDFYTVIKAMDAHLRFVFITGISKFSKVGVFSTLNNLDDLTMDRRFATAFGITEAELENNFREHIAVFAQKEGVSARELSEKIRIWYDGFCFVRDGERVYNPFSTLNLFNKQDFQNYWFESGTPSFLVKLLKARHYDIQTLSTLELGQLAFSTYELEDLAIIPLLFQTGCLTIKSYDPQRQSYKLGYPNQEVEDAFIAYLLDSFSHMHRGLGESYLWDLIDALQSQNLSKFFEVLKVFFANIDYDLYLDYEKYYQTIFYLIFLLLGVRVSAEVKTNKGRIDAVVELKDRIYIFEFKLSGSAVAALKQIKNQEYYQKYRLKGKPMTLVGVKFDKKKHQIAGYRQEMM